MQIVFAVVACLAASLVCLEAHKFPGGSSRGDNHFNRKGDKGPRPEGDKFSWNRTLDANTTVREGGFIKNGSEVAFVRSKDKALRDKGFNASASVYDFSNSTAILIYATDRGFAPCFLASTVLTFSEVKDALAARNVTTVETANKVSLNASATPLSDEEANDLRESNPIVRFVCYCKPIIRVAPPEANAQPSPNATAQVIFFDLFSEVTITYTKRPAVPGPLCDKHFRRPGNDTEGGRSGPGRGGPPHGGPPRDGPNRGGPSHGGSSRGGPSRGGPGGPRRN